MSSYIINSSTDLLNAAADEIDTYGWHRGAFTNSDGGLCTLGAIYKVIYSKNGSTEQHSLLSGSASDDMLNYAENAMQAIENTIEHDSIGQWNDLYCVDAYEAVETLRRAAKLCHEDQ